MGSGSSKQNAQQGSPSQGGGKTAVTSVSTVTQAGPNADDFKRDSKQPLGFSAKEKSRTERNAGGRNHGRSTPTGDRIHGESYGSEVDSASEEVEDVLDEVLRVPVHPRSAARQTAAASRTLERHEGESFPETYAHRRQREQYTLNQQLLLREKTIHRNPREWQEGAVEDVHSGGFDASKFRTANQGKSGAPNDSLSTTKDDFITSSCSETTTYNWDDLDVTQKKENLSVKLPVYDESDMDILASLEKEFL